MTVAHNVALTEQKSMQANWQTSLPDSAVAFSFAYYLQQRADVPVGIILSAWGSSSIEAWMPRDLTKELAYFNTIMQEFDADADRIAKINRILSGPLPWTRINDVYLRRQPNILFNAMMNPLVPYTVRGLVWYQGERNTQSMHGLVKDPWYKNNSGMLKYKDALQAWIKRYRQQWDNSDMHFMLVMLPRFNALLNTSPTKEARHPNAHSWAWMREAQLAAQSMKNVAVINTIDLGHPTNIHPLDKLPIGQRLANAAARNTLHQTVEAQGPVLAKAVISGSNVRLFFEHVEGLRTVNSKAPAEFWLADDSQKWVKDDAKIRQNTVLLSSPSLQNPLYVRYAFSGFPQVNLINAAGLPAQPFRTDHFEP
ncbi:sialate O-acetylesterase [Aliiglaciecola sp. 2_MG-2023]|uniref:sialate O-acetylesterase n=1 Tax=unclassified Aliiglaciecola TaxID=2593648 RepID=UPI0026E18C2A|nr:MULTISPECIES: sialate O-acetylesterase [unclassified Aliiglaciecola]MDO6709271.1 sialate O-acetylesterase [Aliiglaciecola sp. 2_MG-2023]MDO6750419.1 sialate O-acetylesterase [Aliiglaciecola sp. 1_MG-2023]